MALRQEKSRGSAGSIPVEKAAEIPVGVVGLGLMGNSIWGEPAHVLRFMGLTGVLAYGRVMKDLLPDLGNSTEVPALMRKVVDAGGLGVANAQGFYNYTPAEARRWQKGFLKFSYDIRALALKYAERPREKRRSAS